MKRKILVTLLAFCLIASLCVVGAAADGPVAQIGDTPYDTLQAAVDAANDGDTVLLLNSITVDSSITVDKSNCKITLDLGGNTITKDSSSSAYGGGKVILLKGGELTVTNGTIKSDGYAAISGNGAISVEANYTPSDPDAVMATLILDHSAIVDSSSYAGIFVAGRVAQVDVYGSVKGEYYGVSGNGTNNASINNGGTIINVYDGANITHRNNSDGVAVYQPQNGTLNVYGGTMTGIVGIQICSGTVNISGGDITATGNNKLTDYTHTGDGNVVDGAALSIINRSGGYEGKINVNVTGGHFVSENGDAILEYTCNADCEKVESINISGGTFDGKTSDIKVKLKSADVAVPVVTGGTFSSSVAAYVADGLEYEANSDGVYTYHRTIESAVAAAGNDGSVSMISDGTVVDETTGGHTITLIDGGSEITMTVTDGYVYTLPELDKNGYTFTGWRVNNSNTIVRGGESYKITAETTFTAVWNMIMIPDTYDIAVDQPAHGTVDVSLSNASQGSVITVTATPDEGYELVYITVDGEPISGNSFVMPDHAVEVSALFAEIGKEVNFVDVSRADWFYDYVQYVAQNGLMEGTTRTAFEPNASMTRAMFWTVLARIDGETITGDAWKTLAQTWAVESGISDGTNADALITREQMVTMLYRYAGSPVAGGMAISEFTDSASVSDYATDAVTWALSEGILTGMGDGILAPQGTATRAQAAAMLMRFVEA